MLLTCAKKALSRITNMRRRIETECMAMLENIVYEPTFKEYRSICTECKLSRQGHTVHPVKA